MDCSLIISIVTLFVMGIQAWVIYKQSEFMKKQSETMQKQLNMMTDEYRIANRKQEFENSFRITYFYMEWIIPLMGYLSVNGFLNTKMMVENSDKLKDKEIVDFNIQEFEKIYGEKPDDFITKLQNDWISNDKKHILWVKIRKCIVDLDNNMEYFAMHFNSGLASDDVIYDSLHQTFTLWVKILYPFICQNNDSGKPENTFYTNIIKLYKQWTEKERNKERKIKEALETIRDKEENKKMLPHT